MQPVTRSVADAGGMWPGCLWSNRAQDGMEDSGRCRNFCLDGPQCFLAGCTSDGLQQLSVPTRSQVPSLVRYLLQQRSYFNTIVELNLLKSTFNCRLPKLIFGNR